MRIKTERFTCYCGQVFEAELIVDGPVAVAVAAMRAVRCPGCNSLEVYFGGQLGEPPGAGSSIEERCQWWLANGDTGVSSLTIYSAFTAEPSDCYDWPHDPDDFARCKGLLDIFPEWRASLATVSERFPWMGPFILNWDRFEELYAEERSSGRLPKLLAALEEAAAEANRIPNPL